MFPHTLQRRSAIVHRHTLMLHASSHISHRQMTVLYQTLIKTVHFHHRDSSWIERNSIQPYRHCSHDLPANCTPDIITSTIICRCIYMYMKSNWQIRLLLHHAHSYGAWLPGRSLLPIVIAWLYLLLYARSGIDRVLSCRLWRAIAAEDETRLKFE